MNILNNFMLLIGLIGMIVVIFFNYIFEGNDFLKIAVPIVSVILIIAGVWLMAAKARKDKRNG